ncbi:MAG: hypothetical protein LBE76_03995 [Nitrososphaerota archaeon]|nr:hypothetical protein [Nitrososphaerota archaeon]
MSGVGFVVDCLPVADEAVVFADQNGLDVEHLVLYGGEEYELVLTVSPKDWDIVKGAVEAVGGSLFAIGRATVEKQLVLMVNGEKRVIEPLGFEHFIR